jgi:lactate dehydrogenase-like 2-hydroxyacid dehydrogenase
MKKAYVCYSMPDEILAPLHRVASVGVWGGTTPIDHDTLLERVADCDGLLTMLNVRINRQVLEAAPRLRVISQMAVGVDNLDVEACVDHGVVIGHTPEVLTETVADTAFALMASVVRRLPEGERVVREGRWGPWDPWFMLGQDLYGATLGIIGMGRIGQAVARRASGFQMRVLYSSPRDMGLEASTFVLIDSLLLESDIVVVAAPLKPETVRLIGASQLEMMKATSYLVNIARGPLVDTDALVDALRSGSIAGAALDVTDPEPLPSDHDLLALDNCLVVPHIGSASVRARTEMARLAVDNLIAGLGNQPMPARLEAH